MRMISFEQTSRILTCHPYPKAAGDASPVLCQKVAHIRAACQSFCPTNRHSHTHDRNPLGCLRAPGFH